MIECSKERGTFQQHNSHQMNKRAHYEKNLLIFLSCDIDFDSFWYRLHTLSLFYDGVKGKHGRCDTNFKVVWFNLNRNNQIYTALEKQANYLERESLFRTNRHKSMDLHSIPFSITFVRFCTFFLFFTKKYINLFSSSFLYVLICTNQIST